MRLRKILPDLGIIASTDLIVRSLIPKYAEHLSGTYTPIDEASLKSRTALELGSLGCALTCDWFYRIAIKKYMDYVKPPKLINAIKLRNYEWRAALRTLILRKSDSETLDLYLKAKELCLDETPILSGKMAVLLMGEERYEEALEELRGKEYTPQTNHFGVPFVDIRKHPHLNRLSLLTFARKDPNETQRLLKQAKKEVSEKFTGLEKIIHFSFFGEYLNQIGYGEPSREFFKESLKELLKLPNLTFKEIPGSKRETLDINTPYLQLGFVWGRGEKRDLEAEYNRTLEAERILTDEERISSARALSILERDGNHYIVVRRTKGDLAKDHLRKNPELILALNKCTWLLHSKLTRNDRKEYNPKKELEIRLGTSRILPQEKIKANFSGMLNLLTSDVVLVPDIDGHPENYILAPDGTLVRFDLEERGLTNLHYDRAKYWQGTHELDIDLLMKSAKRYLKGNNLKLPNLNNDFILRDLASIVMKAISYFSFSEDHPTKHTTAMGFMRNAIIALEKINSGNYSSQFNPQQRRENLRLKKTLEDLMEKISIMPTYSHSF